jgi:hypothetical protein
MILRCVRATAPLFALWLSSTGLACSEKAPAPGGSASAAASLAASASAAPAASASAATDAAHATIVAALERLAGCETHSPGKPPVGADGKLDLEKLDGLFCPHDVAWEELVDQLDEDDGLGRKNHARLAAVCSPRLGHPSPWVRRAAHRCLAEHPDGVADARGALDGVLTQLGSEQDASVRRAMWQSVGALDPTKHGLAARAVELARKDANDDELLEPALSALVPSSDYVATSPEATSFGVELAKAGRGGEAVVKLLGASALAPAEACEAYAAMLGANATGWATGLEGMAKTEGRCAAFSQRAVDAITARAERATSEADAWTRDATYALRDHLGDLRLDAAAKAKLRGALGKLSKEQREAHGQDVIATVLEKLR